MSKPLYVHSVLCFEDKAVGVRFYQETDKLKGKFYDAEMSALKGVTEEALSSFSKETLLPYGDDLLGTKSEVAGTLQVKDLSNNPSFIKAALKAIRSKVTSINPENVVDNSSSPSGEPVFSVLVEANTKYNTETKQFEPQQFTAEIPAKSALLARKIAKESYAQELGTEPSEIKILKCVLKTS